MGSQRTYLEQAVVPLAALALLLAGCARLPADGVRQDFVPQRDIAAVALYRQSVDYYQRSRLDEAEEKIRQALYIFPGRSNLELTLGAILRSSGQYEEALALYQSIQEREPKLEYRVELAEVYAAMGDVSRAEAEFAEIFDEAAAAGQWELAQLAGRSLAVLAFSQGHEATAQSWSAAAWAIGTGAQERVRHARLLNARGLSSEVLRLFGPAAGSGRDARLLHQVALAHFAAGDRAEALSLAEVALGSGGIDPATATEMESARALIEEWLFREGALEEVDPDEREAYKPNPAFLESTAALYWPVALLQVWEQFSELERE